MASHTVDPHDYMIQDRYDSLVLGASRLVGMSPHHHSLQRRISDHLHSPDRT